MPGRPRSIPALVVSLHDVSPLTRQRSAEILEDLRQAGVQAISLLVIPDHHRKAPVLGDSGFRDWLQNESPDREIVLHGYDHLRAPRTGESTVDRAITRIYTAGEGEFFDLSMEDATRRLERGVEALAWLGFERPAGFIAPAWLLGENAVRAVREAGFVYTTRLDRVERLDVARSRRSQSLVWSTRSAARRLLSLAWNATLNKSLRSNGLMRVGIHPPDWEFPAVRRQILRQIRHALARRTAMTYEIFVRSSMSGTR
jgi:uncharacterized protein